MQPFVDCSQACWPAELEQPVERLKVADAVAVDLGADVDVSAVVPPFAAELGEAHQYPPEPGGVARPDIRVEPRHEEPPPRHDAVRGQCTRD